VNGSLSRQRALSGKKKRESNYFCIEALLSFAHFRTHVVRGSNQVSGARRRGAAVLCFSSLPIGQLMMTGVDRPPALSHLDVL